MDAVFDTHTSEFDSSGTAVGVGITLFGEHIWYLQRRLKFFFIS
jgi:hypothetical protein